jgi:hypothetical protein
MPISELRSNPRKTNFLKICRSRLHVCHLGPLKPHIQFDPLLAALARAYNPRQVLLDVCFVWSRGGALMSWVQLGEGG